ncbi:MAG: Gfo/Idh/MocA family protein [Promethearchaeota archaeon]
MVQKEFIRIGAIGCGWITKSMATLTKFIKSVKIVAGTDLKLENAQKIAGKEHAYTEVDKMLENEALDAVYIALPHYLHKQMIKTALNAGKHILCEKPVAISIQEAREIKQWAEQHRDLKLGFNYDRRYNYGAYKMVSAVHDNHIGKVYFANCTSYYSRDLNYFEKGPWRSKKKTSGGGTLLIHASHMIDILCWALGEPKNVIGVVDTKKFTNLDIEDVGFGTVEFENGTLAQINSSMIVKPRIQRLGDYENIHLFGEKGRIQFGGMAPFSKVKFYGVKKYKIERINRGVHSLMRSMKAFANWVLNDKQFLNTIDESSRALRIVMALYKSAETGKKEIIEKL